MQLKRRNLGKFERKILCWWRTERDLKNQLSLRNRRHFKNISQPKGQQKRYFAYTFSALLIQPLSYLAKVGLAEIIAR